MKESKCLSCGQGLGEVERLEKWQKLATEVLQDLVQTIEAKDTNAFTTQSARELLGLPTHEPLYRALGEAQAERGEILQRCREASSRERAADAVSSIARYNCSCGRWTILLPGRTATCECGVVHGWETLPAHLVHTWETRAKADAHQLAHLLEELERPQGERASCEGCSVAKPKAFFDRLIQLFEADAPELLAEIRRSAGVIEREEPNG